MQKMYSTITVLEVDQHAVFPKDFNTILKYLKHSKVLKMRTGFLSLFDESSSWKSPSICIWESPLWNMFSN